MALIKSVLDLVRNEFCKPDVKWESADMSKEDKAFLQKECCVYNEFDPLELRKQSLKKPYIVRKCKYGQIVSFADRTDPQFEVPWALWGRILRLYTVLKKPGKLSIPFKIYFLAHPSLREFPALPSQIGPQHINGGYTYSCNHETVIIYRAEDATRVLLHELMHSTCMDKMEHGVDHVEAETEAWAELLYIAMLSKGDTSHFSNLLQSQVAWILQQNGRVKKHLKTPTAFPWRYTIAKENVWRRWGLITKQNMLVRKIKSLRLTCPPTREIQNNFAVPGSIIL